MLGQRSQNSPDVSPVSVDVVVAVAESCAAAERVHSNIIVSDHRMRDPENGIRRYEKSGIVEAGNEIAHHDGARAVRKDAGADEARSRIVVGRLAIDDSDSGP